MFRLAGHPLGKQLLLNRLHGAFQAAVSGYQTRQVSQLDADCSPRAQTKVRRHLS